MPFRPKHEITSNMSEGSLSPSLRWIHFNNRTAVMSFLALVSCISCGAPVMPVWTKIDQLPLGNAVDISVLVNATEVIHITDDRFLSVAFTAGDLRYHWRNDYLRSRRLQTLAKGLSPAYLRLGGSRANFATFKETSLENVKSHFKNFTFTGKDWDSISNFSRAVGWRFIFDVNEFLRTNGQWDPTNFQKLLDYNTRKNYTVWAWQLGNEPNAYKHSEGVIMTATQVAEDFIKMRAFLNSRGQYANSLVIGPDVTEPRHVKLGMSSVTFLQEFLSKCGDCTNVTTFHSYYLSMHTAKLDDFINPTTLDALRAEIQAIREVVQQYRPLAQAKIWLTETGDCVPGGISGISDRYVGGFPFLDKLGVSAQEGLGAIMKQQFIGRFVGLVNESNVEPRPVYWVAHLHKQLVGQRVLNVTTSQGGGDNLRIYAHCTQTRNVRYQAGDVTIMALNLDKAKTVQLSLQGSLAGQTIEEYLLTPSGEDGLQARYVNLNGLKLEMMNDSLLPALKPHPLLPPSTIKLPPLSYGYYVVLKSALQVCM